MGKRKVIDISKNISTEVGICELDWSKLVSLFVKIVDSEKIENQSLKKVFKELAIVGPNAFQFYILGTSLSFFDNIKVDKECLSESISNNNKDNKYGRLRANGFDVELINNTLLGKKSLNRRVGSQTYFGYVQSDTGHINGNLGVKCCSLFSSNGIGISLSDKDDNLLFVRIDIANLNKKGISLSKEEEEYITKNKVDIIYICLGVLTAQDFQECNPTQQYYENTNKKVLNYACYSKMYSLNYYLKNGSSNYCNSFQFMNLITSKEAIDRVFMLLVHSIDLLFKEMKILYNVSIFSENDVMLPSFNLLKQRFSNRKKNSHYTDIKDKNFKYQVITPNYDIDLECDSHKHILENRNNVISMYNKLDTNTGLSTLSILSKQTPDLPNILTSKNITYIEDKLFDMLKGTLNIGYGIRGYFSDINRKHHCYRNKYERDIPFLDLDDLMDIVAPKDYLRYKIQETNNGTFGSKWDMLDIAEIFDNNVNLQIGLNKTSISLKSDLGIIVKNINTIIDNHSAQHNDMLKQIPLLFLMCFTISELTGKQQLKYSKRAKYYFPSITLVGNGEIYNYSEDITLYGKKGVFPKVDILSFTSYLDMLDVSQNLYHKVIKDLDSNICDLAIEKHEKVQMDSFERCLKVGENQKKEWFSTDDLPSSSFECASLFANGLEEPMKQVTINAIGEDIEEDKEEIALNPTDYLENTLNLTENQENNCITPLNDTLQTPIPKPSHMFIFEDVINPLLDYTDVQIQSILGKLSKEDYQMLNSFLLYKISNILSIQINPVNYLELIRFVKDNKGVE